MNHNAAAHPIAPFFLVILNIGHPPSRQLQARQQFGGWTGVAYLRNVTHVLQILSADRRGIESRRREIAKACEKTRGSQKLCGYSGFATDVISYRAALLVFQLPK
jgi:hypothetical protein